MDTVQRLHHDDRVAADHAHAQWHAAAGGYFRGFVEDDVEEDLRMYVSDRWFVHYLGRRLVGTYVVAAEGAHDLARAVELDFDAFVEVLYEAHG